jgi:hypothetical protein
MKEVTLKQVPNGHTFTFGKVKFVKQFKSEIEDADLIFCKISGTGSSVYIADHALVEYQE